MRDLPKTLYTICKERHAFACRSLSCAAFSLFFVNGQVFLLANLSHIGSVSTASFSCTSCAAHF